MNNPLSYFENFGICLRLAEMKREELSAATRRRDIQKQLEIETELAFLERSMQKIERAIDCYTPQIASAKYSAAKQADDRIFLRYRYVLGLTMEETAEKMNISRDTAYRIRRRILASG